MRFSTALTLPQPLVAPALQGLLRRMAGDPDEAQGETTQPPQRELPEELDQRVRLLGEW